MTTRLLVGDCRQKLAEIADESVHCIVTSPPYYGLRDYGTAKWEGGDPGCDHVEIAIGIGVKNTLGPTGHLPLTNAASVGRVRQFRSECHKCGAVRVDGQIGLEATPEAYVAELVAVFRECRRVLRSDGSLWLNLGDSYAATTRGSGGIKSIQPGNAGSLFGASRWQMPAGIKPKDLIGIPWLVAFALRVDGWWLRQDIIWAKPNPMPESVTDRCTKAHEYLFLLSKSERYYFDAAAIAEAALCAGDVKVGLGSSKDFDPERQRTLLRGERTVGDTRNRRSVWTIPSAPFSEAHFATFPPALVEPCIKAGCPVGGTVLDPFAGAGTTGLVADRLGRNAVLIELNPAYAGMMRDRITNDAPLFAEVMEAAE